MAKAHHNSHGMREQINAKATQTPLQGPAVDYERIFDRYPYDEDGYAVAVDPINADELRQRMDQYGLVVARVLPRENCSAAVHELFNECGVPYGGPPENWESDRWPSQGRFLYGEGENRTAKGAAAMSNRTHPSVHQVFTALFAGEDRLWVSADTYGVMRPTVGLPFPTPDGKMEFRDRLDWRWSLKLHWDCNPWALQEEIEAGSPGMFQGLVALVDCPEECGGFSAVPGSKRFLPKQPGHSRYGINLTPGMVNGKAYVPEKSLLHSFVQHFPLRAGDMVIWDSRTAHANFPNMGEHFRLVQFATMMRADEELENRGGYWARRLIRNVDVVGQDITSAGRCLLGLDRWDNS